MKRLGKEKVIFKITMNGKPNGTTEHNRVVYEDRKGQLWINDPRGGKNQVERDKTGQVFATFNIRTISVI